MVLDLLTHEFLNTSLLLLIGLVLFHVLRKSTSWTGPSQQKAIDSLREDYAIDGKRLDRAEAQIQHLFQEQFNMYNALKDSIAGLGERLEDVLGLRTLVRDIEERLDQVEEEQEKTNTLISNLQCSENRWHSTERPPSCPLHKEECPLNRERGDPNAQPET